MPGEDIPALAAQIVERAGVFQCLLSDVVKACEHPPKVSIINSVDFKKKAIARDQMYQNIFCASTSGNNVEANRLASLAPDFFATCLKDTNFSIHFAFARTMNECRGRTVRVPKGYLISLAYDPSKKSSNKKEQLTIRFIVAHEIGHIILHEDAKLREFDTGPENKPLPYTAKEKEADDFSFSILAICGKWKDPFTNEIYSVSENEIKEVAASLRENGY